jgi:hypothetical protein
MLTHWECAGNLFHEGLRLLWSRLYWSKKWVWCQGTLVDWVTYQSSWLWVSFFCCCCCCFSPNSEYYQTPKMLLYKNIFPLKRRIFTALVIMTCTMTYKKLLKHHNTVRWVFSFWEFRFQAQHCKRTRTNHMNVTKRKKNTKKKKQ